MGSLYTKIRDYGKDHLDKSQCPDNPFVLFEQWFNHAAKVEPYEANAMVIASVNEFIEPSSRVVLLKEITENSFIFYTNYESQKFHDLTINPKIAGTFWWPECERQVRFKGTVKKTSEAKSDAYFASRSRASQLGAMASHQSHSVESRAILEQNLKALEKKFPENQPIPRPKYWGGVEIFIHYFEFWQGGAHRLHDRITYTFKENNRWTIDRLCP